MPGGQDIERTRDTAHVRRVDLKRPLVEVGEEVEEMPCEMHLDHGVEGGRVRKDGNATKSGGHPPSLCSFR